MPKMQGLHAGRVWHVPLLQGHEEVRRAGPHEAVLCPPAVLSGEFTASSFAQEPTAARQQLCVACQAEEGNDFILVPGGWLAPSPQYSQ